MRGGKTEVAFKRITMLEQAIQYAEVEDQRGNTSEVMFARFALTHYLIFEEQYEAAAPHLEKLRAWWTPRLPEGDPLIQSLDIMEACVRASASKAPADVADLSDKVTRAIRANVSEASQRLGAAVIQRLAGKPSPSHK